MADRNETYSFGGGATAFAGLWGEKLKSSMLPSDKSYCNYFRGLCKMRFGDKNQNVAMQ